MGHHDEKGAAGGSEEAKDRPTEQDESTQELVQTAEHWRAGQAGGEIEESAAEVARGAERGAKQDDYGIEGN